MKASHLSTEQIAALLGVLKARFEKHVHRHEGLEWAKVQARLEASPDKMWSLSQMEASSGEPDVAGQDKKTGEIIFVDCSAETPKGRINLCYDRVALDARQKFKPKDSAMDVAAAMGIETLNETEYRQLQTLGEFDTRTSSWLQTPPEIRKLGGAIFGDRRYGHVFVYHNGADSYYASRGFRGLLRV